MKLGRSFPNAERLSGHCGQFASRFIEICRLPLLAILLAAGSPAWAQSDSSTASPYATLDRQSVTYRGPAGVTDRQMPDGPAVIGMILPLRGAQEPEGRALLAAAQLALEEEQSRGKLPDGRTLALAVRDESGPWGQASTEILKLIEQDHAVVLITSANGATAHQAEQMANKISFPILTLASDSSTTETNIPWLFRLGPSDTDQARAIAGRISVQSGRHKILLIVQMDHDGRVGGEELEKAAKAAKLAAPQRVELSVSGAQIESIAKAIQESTPDAIVVWADGGPTRNLLPLIREAGYSSRIYLCSKAAQLGGMRGDASASAGGYYTVASYAGSWEAAKEQFVKKFRTRTGHEPGKAAFEAYEAVHLIAAGIRANGASRVSLREFLADEGKVRAASEILAFDPAGNSTREFSVIRLSTASIAGE